MSEPQPSTLGQLWRDLGVPAVLGAGAALLAWIRSRRKRCERQAAERAKRLELLHATADAARHNADTLRWLLYVTGPGRGALTREQLDMAASEKRLEVAQGAARIWLAMGEHERRDIRTTQELLAEQPAAPEDEQP